MSDDWGLEAIIRGRTTNLDVDSTAAVMDSWQRCVSALHDLDHELSCKPINDQVLDEPSPEPLSDVSSLLPVVLNIGFSHDNTDDKKIVDNKTKDSVLNTAAHHVHGCRQAKNQGVPRRCRKSKHKIYTVVQQAPFPDSLVLDKWNWRKYGQKAIKGSPYPRSYYRCSSSGDCRARRQVERSCEDPNTYTITYIADHCHPYPTRRYTQAGRTLTRFSPSSAKLQEVIDATTTSVNGHGSRSPPATSNSNDLEQNMDSSVINSTGDVFPRPSGSDVEDKAPAAGFINPNPDFNLPDNLISWDETVPLNHNLGLELQRDCGLGMEEYYHLNSWSDDLWSFDPFLVG